MILLLQKYNDFTTRAILYRFSPLFVIEDFMLISPNFSHSSVILTKQRYAARKKGSTLIFELVFMLVNYCLC